MRVAEGKVIAAHEGIRQSANSPIAMCATDETPTRHIQAIYRKPAGPRFWSGIEELADDPAFQAWVDVEYPTAAAFAPTARREFLKLMGASFALAGLTGCEKSPFVAALPYVDQPENRDARRAALLRERRDIRWLRAAGHRDDLFRSSDQA